MAIRGLIPRNFAELVEAVPIDVDPDIPSGTEGLTFGLNVSEYDQEIPESHTTDQLTTPYVSKRHNTVTVTWHQKEIVIFCAMSYIGSYDIMIPDYDVLNGETDRSREHSGSHDFLVISIVYQILKMF